MLTDPNFDVSVTFVAEIQGTLTDALIVELSDRISAEEKLKKLCMTVLKLPRHKFESALSNNPRSIQSAAYDVLSLWEKQQNNRQEAYTAMQAALGGSEMEDLAECLSKWMENLPKHLNISNTRKYFMPYTFVLLTLDNFDCIKGSCQSHQLIF